MERAEYEVMAAVEGSHWWFGGMRAIVAALLDPLYRYRRNLRILDAGCGTGGNMRFLQRYGQVLGIDLAPEALAFGSGILPGVLARASVLELPFRDDSFDMVTSFDVLYHRGVPDEAVALREVQRVLAPGGRLLVRLPAYEFLRSKHDRAVHTRRRYTAGDVRALLADSGFFVERLSYVNTLLFPVPVAQRLLERVAPGLEQQQSDLKTPAPALNATLRAPLALEAALLESGVRLPYGLSIIALANANKYEHVRVRPRAALGSSRSANGARSGELQKKQSA